MFENSWSSRTSVWLTAFVAPASPVAATVLRSRSPEREKAS